MKFKILKNKEKNVNLNSVINERTREKSTGRSMVEMLGVLAIIGVLSIGGIQGYTIAMRRYRANEILNYINKFALVKYSEFQAVYLNDPDFARFQNNQIRCNVKTYNPTVKYTSYEGCYCFNSNLSLGALPSGINAIGASGIKIIDNKILVGVRADFNENEKELCLTTQSMLPEEFASDSSSYECPDLEYYYVVDEQ